MFVFRRNKLRIVDSDRFYGTLAFADLYVFSCPDRMKDQKNEPSDQISDNALHGHADRNAAGRHQRKDGSHGNTHDVHSSENNQHREDDPNQVQQKTSQCRFNFHEFLIPPEQLIDPVYKKKAHCQDQQTPKKIYAGCFKKIDYTVHIVICSLSVCVAVFSLASDYDQYIIYCW